MDRGRLGRLAAYCTYSLRAWEGKWDLLLSERLVANFPSHALTLHFFFKKGAFYLKDLFGIVS